MQPIVAHGPREDPAPKVEEPWTQTKDEHDDTLHENERGYVDEELLGPSLELLKQWRIAIFAALYAAYMEGESEASERI